MLRDRSGAIERIARILEGLSAWEGARRKGGRKEGPIRLWIVGVFWAWRFELLTLLFWNGMGLIMMGFCFTSGGEGFGVRGAWMKNTRVTCDADTYRW